MGNNLLAANWAVIHHLGWNVAKRQQGLVGVAEWKGVVDDGKHRFYVGIGAGFICSGVNNTGGLNV